MPRTQLTDLTVRSLKADARTDFWDTKTPSFGIRVGKRSKIFISKLNNRRITIGVYPDISLQEARRRALALKSETARSPYSYITFTETLDLFLSVHCQSYRVRTRKEAERQLRKFLLPTLRNKLLSDITTHDVSKIIDRVLPDAPSEATHLFKIARTFFRFSVRRRFIQFSPLTGLPLPAKHLARDRVLTNDELIRLYRAGDSYPFGTIVRLLILTGQRRGEIAALRADWIDFKSNTITLPASITKNARQHTFPFGELTKEILEACPSFDGVLFPARGNSGAPFSGWSKSKAALDKELKKIEPWTLHDLRRTYSTLHAAIGTPPHITERLLNHVTGTISGVAAIYNRHAYMDEMREAVSKWEVRLTSLLNS